jgi:c-di-GMP-binding flagellar brake protein YcgR
MKGDEVVEAREEDIDLVLFISTGDSKFKFGQRRQAN